MLLEFAGKRPQVHKDAFIAPNATLIGDVRVEAGASIWFVAQIRADEGTILIDSLWWVQQSSVAYFRHAQNYLKQGIGKVE